MKHISIISLCILVFQISSYSNPTKSEKEPNDFGFALMKELKPGTEKNFFFSPYSIRTILSLVAEGAAGSTEAQMLDVLHLESDKNKRRSEFKSLIESLNVSKEFKLNTTNTLWIDKTLELLDSYLEIAQKSYLSESKNVDFAKNHKQVRITINKFVESKTNGMIKNLIPEGAIDENTKMVLTNTIYFKGEWEIPFDKNRTHQEDFHLVNKQKTKVDMMKNTDHFRSGKVGKTSVIELPYKGGEISMWVLLPDEENTERLVAELSSKEIQKLKAGAKSQKTILSIPKFDFESTFSLAKNLDKMGMKLALSDNADFSGISKKTGLKISEVIHKAKITVEEKTTEAAAATAVVMVATSSAFEPKMDLPFVFNANKPFVFFIEHKNSANILFMGVVNKP